MCSLNARVSLVATFDSLKKGSIYLLAFLDFFFHFGWWVPIKNKLEKVSSHEAFL